MYTPCAHETDHNSKGIDNTAKVMVVPDNVVDKAKRTT